MGIILNRLSSETVSNLIDILQVSEADKRLTAYYGVSIALVKLFLANTDKNLNKPELQLKINNISNEIAEKAILDRSLFENIFNKVFNFYYNQMITNYNYSVYEYNCVVEAFGVGDVLAKSDIEVIDNNLEYFKRAYVAANDCAIQNSLTSFTTIGITFKNEG